MSRLRPRHGDCSLFQVRNRQSGDITTLGRGGSDNTKVALQRHADVRDYSDVDGVFTADPRIVPTAHKLDTITSEDAGDGGERCGCTCAVNSSF